MRTWSLKPGDPLSLTLSADARLGSTDYFNDIIWELGLGGGDPPAMALQTTYGLRARSLRLFPRFSEGGNAVSDPGGFARAPTVTRIYPNYTALQFSPFQELDVVYGVWVPDSQGLCGRVEITNVGEGPRNIRFDLAAQLVPHEGERMASTEIQAVTVLAGVTESLKPVVFLTGGAEPTGGAYPSLGLQLELQPGETRSVTWSHAAANTRQESFEKARMLATRRWDAEIARVELQSALQVEVHTGNLDWDAAFALAQNAAAGLFLGPVPSAPGRTETDHSAENSGGLGADEDGVEDTSDRRNLPGISFVLSRQPDLGYSRRGDGSDYNYLWSGQTPLDSYYLASITLPACADPLKDVIRNFLATQDENGKVDWRPGLSGQRGRHMATPVLARLAWRIYEASGDKAFLEESFPGLLRFVQTWFSSEFDIDGDGIPEWGNTLLSGLEDTPTFSHWNDWSLGVDIRTAETPSLCSMLYSECCALMDMAKILGRMESISALQSFAEHLKTAVEISWDAEWAIYRNWDRDTHRSPDSQFLGQRLGSGDIQVGCIFEEPERLLIHLQTTGERTRKPTAFIRGTGASGLQRVEQVDWSDFRWYLGRAAFTGERLYSSVDSIEISGLDEGDEVSIWTVGYEREDISLLLPLWAGIPSPERAEQIVRRSITNNRRYWGEYGLPICPTPPTAGAEICGRTHLLWNLLVSEGLLRYGYREEAAELFQAIMPSVLRTLVMHQAFRQYYREIGHGERNVLQGIPPVGLFLDILGVRPLSARSVRLEGSNPFPWPVTVKYRGLTVLRQRSKTVVIFPDGQTVEVQNTAPSLVSLE